MSSSESCLESLPRSASWTRVYGRISSALATFYCRAFHGAISRPVNGKYRCWQCLREFDIQWR